MRPPTMTPVGFDEEEVEEGEVVGWRFDWVAVDVVAWADPDAARGWAEALVG